MESHEEEYQCSDCGATVPVDSKTCQKCGASLEEISEEETSNKEVFVQIPVTSHPANLSSILSLLDEKKIDYSINDDAMENIWGSNFIQVPRLLVHKEQVEEVKEIINSIHEEVEVLDEDVFKDSISEKGSKKEKVKGVEGYLLVLSLLLILGPIAYLPYYIFDFFQSQNYLSRYPLTFTLVILDLITSIFISFLSISAGIKLFKVKQDAVEKVISYFNIFIFYQAISFIVVAISFSNIKLNSNTINFFDLLISETISSILFAIVAKLYLKNSERVKNTYDVQ